MAEADDRILVAEFVDEKSDAAFRTLARRHINLVFSVALRCTGNAQDAEDVSQAVFILLARKAAGLRNRASLTGWLYETTRFTASRVVRSRARQWSREQEAFMQSQAKDSGTSAVWRKLEPLLEEGMSRLSESERTLLALRFFENKSGAEAASVLGIAEWAAHKRSARALEKLRKFFQGRGVASTTAVIAEAMAENSVQAAPVGLANAVGAAGLAQGTVAGGTAWMLAKGGLNFMAWTKIQTVAAGAIVVGLAMFSASEHAARARLRADNENLQAQMESLRTENERLASRPLREPQLPAPVIRLSRAAEALVETNSPVGIYDRLKDKHPQLTREQVEAFLKANGRSAGTLLAAFRTSGDRALLAEAAEKFPNDPQVAFEAVLDHGMPPEDKRLWLDAFERSAPDNALANYLSAVNYFNAGQTDKALQEMTAANGKRLDDYTIDRVQGDVEAYVGAGYSLADAKAEAASQLTLPQLAPMKQYGLGLIDVAAAYRQSGDVNSAQAVLQMAANMGQQYATPVPGEATVSQLVGLNIERTALGAMDPTAPYGSAGMTAQDALNQVAQQTQGVRALEQEVAPLLPLVSDADWVIYKDRWLMFGRENAQQWVVTKYGGK